jgi:hypothetical protein
MNVLTVQFQSRTEERTLLSTHAMNVLKVRIDARRNESSYDARRRKVSSWRTATSGSASLWYDGVFDNGGQGIDRRLQAVDTCVLVRRCGGSTTRRRWGTPAVAALLRVAAATAGATFFSLLSSTLPSICFKRCPASSSGCDI